MAFDATTNEIAKLIYARLLNARRVLVVGHVNPDGDALASMAAVLELLGRLDKPMAAYAKDKQASNFYFLPHEDEVRGVWPENWNLSDFDMLVTVDCGSLSRTSLEAEIKALTPEQRAAIFIAEFDHHPQIDDFADATLRFPSLASTTEVLYDFFKANDIALDRNLAECVLTGILTDTSNFLYPSTSDETVTIASEMLKYGARFGKILQLSSQNKSWLLMKIMALALNNLAINNKYEIAVSVIALADLATIDLKEFMGPAHVHELNEIYNEVVAFLSNLGGVRAVLLLRESEPGHFKGSWRSAHPEANVATLARYLGGGGHAKAAGFSFDGQVAKTESGWKMIPS
jgi:phosphoesterase RecJ-like protein